MSLASITPPRPTPASTPRVANAIASASARTGVDFDYLFNQARVESGLNPSAKAKTSTASGLFQFTRQTWLATVKEHGATHGLGWASEAITKGADGTYRINKSGLGQSVLDMRFDPEASSAMAAEFASDNRDYLSQRLGHDVDSVDLYLAHFLGAGGAAKFLSAHDAAPHTAAAPLFPAAAAANRSIFYKSDGSAKSLSEIRGSFDAKMRGAVPASFQTVTTTQSKSQSQSASQPPRALAMQDVQAMPGRLSLAFAQSAYARVAADRGL